MKNSKYQRRFYRDWVKTRGLHLQRVTVKETDLQVLTDKLIDRRFIVDKVSTYRGQIESYIGKDKRFLVSLKPIAVELRAPAIVRQMSRQAAKANVGPMAAVAGAIAEFLGRALLRKGCKDVIIENGGDIFLKVSKPRIVGIYAGRVRPWKGLGLKIKPGDTPLGICTSSGVIGHSLSFGCANAVVILSKNASLADAVATATANLVRSRRDLEKAVAFAKSIRGISGVVIIIKKHLLSWGRLEFAA